MIRPTDEQIEVMDKMSAREARKILSEELKRRNLDYKLTAKTVSFSGFGYGRCVFVTINNMVPDPVLWKELKEFAKEKGFRIE